MKNPYQDTIVPDPETHPAVTVLSLHQAALRCLLDRMEDGFQSGKNQTKASVVISSRPGFGKTHLLSRALEAILPQSFSLFIPPLNETRGMARGVLNRLVSRLWRGLSGDTNQFERLTFQLFAAVTREDPAASLAWGEFDLEQLKVPAIQQEFAMRRDELAGFLSMQLGKLPGLRLHERPYEWALAFLDVLSADIQVETGAVEWIKGRSSFYPGLSMESDAGTEPEEEISRAEHRLADLIRLFTLARPIVLVFDQIENLESFGPESLRCFFHLVERLLTECPALQIVVAANAVDWKSLLHGAALPESFRDRFHQEIVLKGLNFAQAVELRDLRASSQNLEASRMLIPDQAIREKLSATPDGRAQVELSPRAFLQWCAGVWERPAGKTAGVAPVVPDFSRELDQARALAQGESFGFYPDVLRTFFAEIFQGIPKNVGGYEFLCFDQWIVFAEQGASWSRWRAWVDRARLNAGSPGKIVALRPSRELCRCEHLAWQPVPGDGWSPAHPLRQILESGARIRELEPCDMLDILAACRFLDAAGDFGSSRKEAAAWYRQHRREKGIVFFLQADAPETISEPGAAARACVPGGSAANLNP